MKKRVADIVVDTLANLGITDCFAVVGGGAMHLDNALLLHKDIHKVFNHHEQACAMAAEAYARYSGKIAAVCVTSGPGATNTLTGVMGAWVDSIPMIVISGQVRYEISVPRSGLNLRCRGIQEFDIIHSVQNMTKYAKMVTDPLSIRQEIVKAISIAMEGRRGPVWLDIPLDIQGAQVEENDLYPSKPVHDDNLIPEMPDVEDLLNKIQNAERPCILSGSGIVSSHTMEQFEKFVNRMGIPVIGASWIPDSFYGEHPLYYGISGDSGPRMGNFVLQTADVILALGNSLGFKQTGFAQEGFAPNAKIYMVNTDPEEARKPGLRVEKVLQADLRQFFRISELCRLDKKDHSQWISHCDALRNRFPIYETLDNVQPGDRVSKYYFWHKVQMYEPDDSMIVLGNSGVDSAKLQLGVQKKGQRALTNNNCGSMGYDLPASIGAAVASGKHVLCVTGEGSVMMNLQELQTIVQYDLPIHVVIFSNGGYGCIRQTHTNYFGGNYVGCTPDSGISFPDFEKIANTFGFQYIHCRTNAEVDSSVKKLFAQERRILMEVDQKLVDPDVPSLKSRMNENGEFQSPILHDMAPFLEKSELEKWTHA